MIYEIGQLFYVREKFSILEAKGTINYKFNKGDIAKVDRIFINSAFKIQIKIGENIYRFSEDEMKLHFFSQAEWRDEQINSILND